MKISPINLKSYNSSYNQQTSFQGGLEKPLSEQDYRNAKNYFNFYADNLDFKINLSTLNSNQLNGIQYGIDVFDGLSMDDILYVITRGNILVNRGCSNGCIHCLFGASPFSIKTLDRMSWEDFSSYIEGAKELASRMKNKIDTSNWFKILFLDSDCMDMEIKDKEGNSYDFVDCVKKILEVNPDYQILFDTTGWCPKSQNRQKRAEKIRDFILKHKNNLREFNISVNPFHQVYINSKEQNNPFTLEEKKKKGEEYIKRIANTLYTFTPLLSLKKYNVIARAIPDNQTDNPSCNKTELRSIIKQITDELRKMYEKDFEGKQEFVKSKKDIDKLTEQYETLLKDDLEKIEDASSIVPIGRAEKLFRNPQDSFEERKTNFMNYLKERKHSDIPLAINPNGKIVTYYADMSIPSDIKLNFENKDKEVKPLGSEIKDFIFVV